MIRIDVLLSIMLQDKKYCVIFDFFQLDVDFGNLCILFIIYYVFISSYIWGMILGRQAGMVWDVLIFVVWEGGGIELFCILGVGFGGKSFRIWNINCVFIILKMNDCCYRKNWILITVFVLIIG